MKGAATLERMAIESNRTGGSPKWSSGSSPGSRPSFAGACPTGATLGTILQDVFYELVEANHLLMPIEHLTGWLFRVARNRTTDLVRKQKPESFSNTAAAHEKTDDDELLRLDDLLPSPDAGRDALYARNLLLDELESAVAELPGEQREVFVAHELEGRSFKQMAADTGVSLNTVLSRKPYAVLYLRERLQSIYDEFTIA
jgi:RNA polymerase sigma factor (sigma-70 family)